jgi:O-antigen ligase
VTRPAEAPRPRTRGFDLLLGIPIGLAIGFLIVELISREARYAVYGLAALLGAVFLPRVVTWVGSLERLLFAGLVLALQFDVAVAFSFRQYKPAGPYGYLVSPVLLAAASLVALRAVAAARRLAPPLVLDGTLVRGTGVMLLAGLLSAVNASDKQLLAFGLFELVTLGLVAVATVDQCSTRDGLRLVQRLLGWTLVLQSALIVLGFATGVQISLSSGTRGADYGWAASGRFSGTLTTPSGAGTMLFVCLIGVITRLYQPAASRERLWVWAQIGLGGFALLLTQTRSAWIGLILGAGGVLAAAVRRGDLSQRSLLQLGGAAFAVFLAAWPFVAARVTETHSDDAEVRFNLVRVAAEMILSHPLVGIGLNTATHQVPAYAAKAGVGGWVFIVHNQFLLVLAETGLLGLFGFLTVFGAGLRGAGRLKPDADLELRNAGLWLFWSIVALIWALNLDHVSGAPTYKLVFFLVAVAAGAARLATTRAPVEAAPRVARRAAP